MNRRKLTEQEIERIVGFVKVNARLPQETTASLVMKARKAMIAQLRNVEVIPSIIPELAEKLQEYYEKSMVQAG